MRLLLNMMRRSRSLVYLAAYMESDMQVLAVLAGSPNEQREQYELLPGTLHVPWVFP